MDVSNVEPSAEDWSLASTRRLPGSSCLIMASNHKSHTSYQTNHGLASTLLVAHLCTPRTQASRRDRKAADRVQGEILRRTNDYLQKSLRGLFAKLDTRHSSHTQDFK